ncbi:MAG: arginine deiminase-related protein [Bacteroidetes bacterium]|nr:arginine deiminase-related protein [Bacteroidota bacterium]
MARVKGLVMIEPIGFRFNSETATTNSFQHNNTADVQAAAFQEWQNVVYALRQHQFEVITYRPLTDLTPDAVFPNNWFSTHDSGKLLIYPMMANNRRAERNNAIVQQLQEKYNYHSVINLSRYETQNAFLEGTGSIVFDHDYKLAYAAISPRTHLSPLLEVCEHLGCLPVVFETKSSEGNPIYHTNVVMSIGSSIAIAAEDCIVDERNQLSVRKLLQFSNKTILSITNQQMQSFCGNVLFATNTLDKEFAILSDTAWNSFTQEQQMMLSNHATPIIVSIPIIERVGGGGVRCMIAELL